MKKKPGPKPMLERERLYPKSITANADEWKWCIAQAHMDGYRSVAAYVRSLIQKAQREK